MNKTIEISLIETAINTNGKLYFPIIDNIKRIEFISNEFYENRDRKINKTLHNKYYEELVDIIIFIMALNLPINTFNKNFFWSIKTQKYLKDSNIDLYLDIIRFSISDYHNINIHISFIFKDYTHIELQLTQKDKERITNIILHNYWFEQRERIIRKNIENTRK